jgi:uncharacterized protein (DUF58 family)
MCRLIFANFLSMQFNGNHSTLKLNTKLILVLLALLIVLQLISPYRGWVIMLIGLGGMFLLSSAWVISLRRGLILQRFMRLSWAQVGDWLQERFEIDNHGFFPALWLEVIDHSTMPNYQASRVVAVGGFESRQWFTESVCEHRGVFTLGPLTVRTGDPFGLFTLTQEYPQTTTLIVMPPIVPLPSIEVAPSGRAGEGKLRANTFERTVSTYGVRSYAPGDSLRSIHWRTSARRDDFFVRLFDSTPAGDWWLFLDLEEKMQAGQGEDSTSEHSIILAASLADMGIRAGRAVGLVAQGKTLTWLPPLGGDSQRWEILRALALANLGGRPLHELLNSARSSIHNVASLIILTASPYPEWIEALLPLAQRGLVPTVILLDPASFGEVRDINHTAQTLQDLGITRYVVTKDWLDRPEAQPGKIEWRVSATGKARQRLVIGN